MPRIRTIKPEFWTDEAVMECSPNARLLFIGMWNFADDAGRLRASARQLKAQIFPADDFSLDTILGMVEELSENELIEPYTVDGKDYLQITGWHNQRIDKPQAPKHPAPDQAHSETVPGIVADHSRLIGREGKGKEGSTPNGGAAAPDDLDKTYYANGKAILGQSAGGQLTKLKNTLGIGPALEALETAKRKQDPAEYVAGILKAKGGGPKRKRVESDAARDDHRSLATYAPETAT